MAPQNFQSPQEDAWLSFLRHMLWTDTKVLRRQPALFVYQAWVRYQARVEFGLLGE